MGNTPSADVALQKVEDQLDRNSCKEEDMMMMKASMLWEPALQLAGEEDPIFDDFVILDEKKKKEEEEKTDLDQDSFVVVDDREEERNKESEQDQHVEIVMNENQSMPIPEPLVVVEEKKKLISVQKKKKQRVVRQEACLACKERILKGQHLNQIQHNQCSFLCAHCKVHLMPGNYVSVGSKHFCKVHYGQFFKVKSKYRGSTPNIKPAKLQYWQPKRKTYHN